MIKEINWPIFWCLEPGAQALLMQFQWNEYGYRLEVPRLPKDTHIDTEIESPEEIGKIMRQAPSKSRE